MPSLDNIKIIVQKHKAKKAGLHYDVRFVHPAHPNKVVSLVTRRKEILPTVTGQSRFFMPISRIHDEEGASFSGNIAEGYGAGEVEIFKVIDNAVTDLYSQGTLYPDKFTVKIGGEGTFKFIRRDYQSSDGYLVVRVNDVPGVHPETIKDYTYRSVDENSVEVKRLLEDPNIGMMDKLDGAGMYIVIANDGTPYIISKRPSVTGEPIIENSKVKHLVDNANKSALKKYAGYILRGEIHSMGDNPKDSLRYTSSVLLSKPDKANQKQNDTGRYLTLSIFGVVGKKSNKGISSIEVPYTKDREVVKNIVQAWANPHVKTVDIIFQDKGKFFDAFHEGGIFVFPEFPVSKTNPFIKVKHRYDVNLKLIGITEGTGRLNGAAGSLIAVDKSGQYQVNVGSGLTDDMRRDIANNFNKYKDKIIKVGYRDRTGSSLRGPVFLGFAEDKNVPDSLA